MAARPKPPPPFPSVSPPPPPPPPTLATGMTVIPSSWTLSPKTFLTDIASRAPLNSSSRFISGSFEIRFAFLEERAHPLAGILGAQCQSKRLPLVLDAELQRALERAVDGLLRKAQRERALLGDGPGQTPGLVEPCLALDHAGDQPGRLRLVRSQEASREDHVHRDCLADRPRKPLRAPRTGHQAE